MVLNHSLTDLSKFNNLFQPHGFLINSHNSEKEKKNFGQKMNFFRKS